MPLFHDFRDLSPRDATRGLIFQVVALFKTMSCLALPYRGLIIYAPRRRARTLSSIYFARDTRKLANLLGFFHPSVLSILVLILARYLTFSNNNRLLTNYTDTIIVIYCELKKKHRAYKFTLAVFFLCNVSSRELKALHKRTLNADEVSLFTLLTGNR